MLTKFSFLLSLSILSVWCDDWVIETDTWPGSQEVPSLSNGHIGFNISSDTILMNGLYNGKKGVSHRARIPNMGNLQLNQVGAGLVTYLYRLDMGRGLFEIVMTGTGYRATQQIYAHRFYTRAMINKVTVERTLATPFRLSIVQEFGGNPGTDLTLTMTEKVENISGNLVRINCYRTIDMEHETLQLARTPVCTAATIPLESSFTEAGEYLHVFTVGTTEAEVTKEMQDVLESEKTWLLQRHVDAWQKHWNRFAIQVDNTPLNQIILSSTFYLVGNLPSEESNQPNGEFFGLSPGGIPKGGGIYQDYQGHSFWDTEMWMHPPILLLNPRWSEDLLKYRYNVRNAARQNANATGYKGYRFPWESGYTGCEVTPDCCPEVVEYQHHIIADIAFAFRAHLAATHDLDWFKHIGCDIAYNTAKFWESRVKFNESTGLYDIRGVMGPDEDHPDIDNNVYTNVNAAINLYFGEFASCVCKDVLELEEADFEGFSKVARSIALLYDEKDDFHPQYEGYTTTTEIKQADAILLGFPLGLPMNDTTKRNDLLTYDKVSRENGPAMTWAMHTIGFLDLNDETEAAKYLQRSYSLYNREPFKVWSEAIPTSPGAGNFITGAGGFLQSIINGYGGVRLHFDKMTIKNFHVPPQSTMLTFNGITYLGSRFSLHITRDKATIKIVELNRGLQMKVTRKSANGMEFVTNQPIVGQEIAIARTEELILEPAWMSYGDCELKETVLGMTTTTADASGKLSVSSALVLLLAILKAYFI